MTGPEVSPAGGDLLALRRRLADEVVGREHEIDLVLAAVAAGRDLMIEGPPGTSKSTILRALTAAWGIPLHFVEGNAELTPAKLIGHHNPARVLREDYSSDNFVPGPLVAAVQDGGFLYVEEFNRAPEDTLNALLTAIAEREVTVPRVGTFTAAPSFRVVASMNPFDNVGTTRISTSVYDRMCRMAVDYQDARAEERIVALRTGIERPDLVADAVALTRATRRHAEIRQGSSVRGAIDAVLVTDRLDALDGTGLDGTGLDGDTGRDDPGRADRRLLDGALLALSGRIHLHETSERTPEQVITELWEELLLTRRRAARGERAVDVDVAVQLPGSGTARGPHRTQPLTRRPKELTEPPDLYTVDGGGGLVVEGGGSNEGRDPPGPPGRGAHTGVTAERGRRQAVADVSTGSSLDPEVLAAAQEIAQQLGLRRRHRGPAAIRGSGPLRSVPYRYNSDDIDIDRTLDVLTERPVPDDTDIVVRERMRSSRAIALMVDVSGSMRGDKAKVAAAAVGALCGDLDTDELAVIAFWADAAIVSPMGTGTAAQKIVERLLRIPAKGLTNVHFALETGRRELAASRARVKVGLLLSDVVHNAGPDPRALAPGFARLGVLLQTDGEHDADLAADLARLGRGRLGRVRSYHDVAPALHHVMT